MLHRTAGVDRILLSSVAGKLGFAAASTLNAVHHAVITGEQLGLMHVVSSLSSRPELGLYGSLALLINHLNSSSLLSSLATRPT